LNILHLNVLEHKYTHRLTVTSHVNMSLPLILVQDFSVPKLGIVDLRNYGHVKFKGDAESINSVQLEAIRQRGMRGRHGSRGLYWEDTKVAKK